MLVSWVLLVVLAGGLVALLFAFAKTRWIYRQKVDHPVLVEVSGHIAEGAMTFLGREFKVLSPFVLVVALLLAVGLCGPVLARRKG